jgi:transposase-like protein
MVFTVKLQSSKESEYLCKDCRKKRHQVLSPKMNRTGLFIYLCLGEKKNW